MLSALRTPSPAAAAAADHETIKGIMGLAQEKMGERLQVVLLVYLPRANPSSEILHDDIAVIQNPEVRQTPLCYHSTAHRSACRMSAHCRMLGTQAHVHNGADGLLPKVHTKSVVAI